MRNIARQLQAIIAALADLNLQSDIYTYIDFQNILAQLTTITFLLSWQT